MSRYFGKFSGNFSRYSTFFGLWIFHRIKIGFLVKSLRTTGLDYAWNTIVTRKILLSSYL